MSTTTLRLCAMALLLPLAACVNMSGLSGGSKYACAAPEGVACDSVSGTYANALHENLPSQRTSGTAAGDAAAPSRSAVPVAPSPVSARPARSKTRDLCSPSRRAIRETKHGSATWCSEDAKA